MTTRRILGIVLATALLGSVFAGAVSAQGGVNENAKSFDYHGGTFALAQRIIDRADSGEPLRIIIQNQGLTTPVFGAEQRIGTDRGCEANGDRGLSIACRLTGPAERDDIAQVSELQALRETEQVDCIAVQSPTPDLFVDEANAYIDAGIPFFTQNTDIPNSRRIAFFALNEVLSGQANGRATAALVEEQGLGIGGIGLGTGGPDGPWAQQRMQGFMEGFQETYPDADFKHDPLNALPVGFPDYLLQQALDQADPYLRANPDVNLLFHTDQGVEGVGEVINRAGWAGEKWTSGFNVSLPILDMIDAGVILVTINQGFDNQAEAGVRACVDLLADGTFPEDPLAFLQPIIITQSGAAPANQSSADARAHLEAVLAE